MIQLKINDKIYQVQEAKTDQEKIRGLQRVKELPLDGGMLFYFVPPQTADIWMKDTLIPLDIVFINDDFEVMKVEHGKPLDLTHYTCPNTAFVLEVNENSGIKKGDEMELDPDHGPVMKVLGPDGKEQMALWGGERIFRRAFTRQLVAWAKKTKEVKKDNVALNNIYLKVGKKMFKELKAQDTRKPEYVDAPN